MSDKPADIQVDLDKDFEVDQRLFHYTSSAGLYGILQSGCLWATHFKFLSDNQEFIAAKRSIAAHLKQEISRELAALKVSGRISIDASTTIAELSAEQAEIITEAWYTVTLKLAAPFVFSSYVCAPGSSAFRNGELLHWATYGRNGGYVTCSPKVPSV